MTLTSILVTIVLILALYAKWKLIRVPKGYTFIGELDKPVEALAITNSPDDASSWKLLKPLEQRLPVPLEVFKIMEYDLALKKKEELQKNNDENESLSIISTFDEVKKDSKTATTTFAIVKRRTLAKNLKVKELHAIYIRHTSKDGEGITAKGEIDTEQIYERVYIIKDAEAAKKLFSEEENWIAAADNRVAQFFRDYGVQHNFATIKETPIDKIIEEVNHTPKLAKIKDVASLEKYFNDTFFRKQGFTIGNLTKRAVLYGPDSKDIFQTKENLANKIAENAIQDEVNNQKIKDATASKKAWDEKKSITKDQVDFQKELYGSQGAAIKEATSGTFSNTPQVTHVVMSNDMNKNVIEAMQNVPTVIEFLKEQKPTETNKPVLQIANSSDKNKGKKTNNQTPTPDNGTAEPEEKGGEENG